MNLLYSSLKKKVNCLKNHLVFLCFAFLLTGKRNAYCKIDYFKILLVDIQLFLLNKLIKDLDLTQVEISKRFGKNPLDILNKLKLLEFTNEERVKIIENDLTENHARILLRIDDAKLRLRLLNFIIIRK